VLFNRLYYRVKPLIPWSARMAIRRFWAVRKRARTGDIWPIYPGSEQPPPGWPGWPEGRQFAFVLTHDVEGPQGLARVQELAELEMSLGFRSAFNFIPEGTYRVPAELRAWLTSHGFEVGVHDLRHDGHLFRCRRDFVRHAARINAYLRDWGAVGFRSGFMLHQLDWLHDLQIQYDASTFDTDPFEPQPFGRHTLFPFWVPAENSPAPTSDARKTSAATGEQSPSPGIASASPPLARPGYLELPYTLPQDSTLFLLFRERTPALWWRKLDWIAQHGGMALVNVHPDYLQFPDQPATARTFPVDHYTALLRHVRDRHAGRYWHALPRELAAYAATALPPPPRRKPLRVCMVTHSFYARDNRVIRYAESLAARGDEVDVINLRARPDAPREERVNGVNVFCLRDRFSKHGESAGDYLRPILWFFLAASGWITRRYGRRRYDLFHIHNIPDFLVFTAWYPRLRGARILLDIHDIVPEFFASKFSVPLTSWRIRGLQLQERWSARFAHHVIIANHLWLDKYVRRSARADKCSVFINNVDARVFQLVPQPPTDGAPVILFPGGLQWHQGLDIGLRAFQKIASEFPRAEFHIYGDGNEKPQLIALAAELGLQNRVRFFEPRPIREIAAVMARADLGVVPKRADSFGNEAYSTKIMEFMALGVPVVVSRTKIDQYYFPEDVVRFFESGNPEAMATAMAAVLRDPRERAALTARAQAYAAQHSWDTRQADYLRLVDDLCDSKS